MKTPARGTQQACTLHRAALGVVNLFLDTVKISNKDRGNRGVKMRAETREKGRQIIRRDMKVKRGGHQQWPAGPSRGGIRVAGR